MTRWKKALLVALGAVTLPLAATGGYSMVHPEQKPVAAPAPRRPLTCKLEVGEELGFRVHGATEGKKPEAPAPERMSLDGEMWWRVVEQRASSGWVVAAILHDVHQEGGKDAATDAALQ